VLNERSGLARRKMLRLLAPQSTEAPIFFHLTKSDNATFTHAVEQMAEVCVLECVVGVGWRCVGGGLGGGVHACGRAAGEGGF
jgi:hypothetical protein